MESVNVNINLTVDQLIQAVKQLSPEDKLKLNDAIWDESYVVPEWHKQIVRARIKEVDSNPDLLLDWDEVSESL
ncbi:addiction module protein [Flavobacterium sp. RHBU_3]|uniref:addiction module protein n=1 Tax=Flavobacterium sp. RHBU_3 TaxID=3391184 RepID=UPI0039850A6C